jgi:hypothetical protein
MDAARVELEAIAWRDGLKVSNILPYLDASLARIQGDFQLPDGRKPGSYPL